MLRTCSPLQGKPRQIFRAAVSISYPLSTAAFGVVALSDFVDSSTCVVVPYGLICVFLIYAMEHLLGILCHLLFFRVY